MEFTVVTYGAGEVLHQTFNAIAAVLNSGTGTLYKTLVRLSLVVGLLWTVVSMVYGDKLKVMHNWLVPVLCTLYLFFISTCKMHIKDPVTNYHFTVDHVPWGLGLVAGTLSQIGDNLTREIEKVFSLPDDLKYHKTGSLMASNLMASARTFHITNEDVAETMRSFVNQCMVYDALLGRKYTVHDLHNSPDLWKLATENPSPARCFTYKEPGRNKVPEILTCQKGVERLAPLFQENVRRSFGNLEPTILGVQKPPGTLRGTMLRQYLPGAFNYMTGMAKTAEEIMMQQMMVYSVVDSIETKSTALGNAPNFAVRKAYLQQRATQETLTGVAAQKLVAMKNVMEALIYTAFIFLLPLAMVPFGWKFIGRWVSLVMWVQLWAPLYAILNFIMNMSLRSKGIGLITSAGGITIANSVGFANLHADMASQAGFMTIAVGSLAYAIIKGGTASFVHLASHLEGPAMSTSASAAESLVSGNYSFGNVTSGTVQASNTTFGQQMWSPSYNSGAFSQHDGNVSRTTTSDDGHIINISNSNLRSNLQLSESLSKNYTEQASKASQAAENQLVAATEAQAEHNRNVLDLSQHQAKSISSGETHSTGKTASTNQNFQQLDNLVDRFAKDHNISKELSGQIMANVSASMSTGTGFELLGTGVTSKFSASVTGQMMAAGIDRSVFSAAQDYSKQHNFQEALTKASQAAHDLKYSELNDTGKRYVDSINASSEKSHQYRNEANASLQKSELFSKMASWTKQNAGSINANLNQEYVNWLQTQSLPNSKGPMGITEAETILSNRPDLDHAYQKRFLAEKMQHMEGHFGTHGLPSSNQAIERGFQKAQRHIKPSPENSGSKVQAKAFEQGLEKAFTMDSELKKSAQAQLRSTDTQVLQQQESVLRQGKIRRDIIEGQTK